MTSVLQCRRLPGGDNPIDEYIDPIVKVFGKSPSREDSLRVCREEVPKLTTVLSDWLELDIDESEVRRILQAALNNYFGGDVACD